MGYASGEWTKEDIIALFGLDSNEQEESNPDVVYSGRLIEVKNEELEREEKHPSDKQQTFHSLSEIEASPHSIAGNLFEIRKLYKK